MNFLKPLAWRLERKSLDLLQGALGETITRSGINVGLESA